MHSDAEAADLGRRLMRGRVTFLKGAVSQDTLPPPDRPELAFAGRSNVGKSSLVNALTGRKTLARTSGTPGRTQELNYFCAGEDHGLPFYLVDLPGYGYAQVSRSRVRGWQRVMRDYLVGRASLRRVFVLVDARHGLKDKDREVMSALDKSAVNYQIVLTKADKLKKAERDRISDTVREQAKGFIALHPLILVTSAEKGWGLDELAGEMATLVSR
ncbi:ribosome biogenesis GTP-binding protein YihA/YsxC [Yunchengibacter salinarum]|uniref:ribosome biogenesis GTP-binding protein YihA/YsxC n=1 Tax=Yunchengibacter salinarum TaxID=3133399 RepID=UPI0035B652C1